MSATKGAKPTRRKKGVLVYLQRDIEAIKHTLDEVVRPFKSEMKGFREANAALRGDLARKEEDIEKLLRLIQREDPALIDEALACLLDPSRAGWKKFRHNWRERLRVK